MRTMTDKNKALWQAGLIVALPAIAVAAAYLFFPGDQQQRDRLLSRLGATNHGVLIEPARTIARLGFTTVGGKGWQVGGNSKWKLVVASDGECGKPCQNALYLTRQIHKLLPRRSHRLERFYISQRPPSDRQQQLLAEQYPATRVLLDSAHHLQRQLAGTNVPANREGFFYLLDSRGRLVLFYSPQHEYKQVIKDLKVLL